MKKKDFLKFAIVAFAAAASAVSVPTAGAGEINGGKVIESRVLTVDENGEPTSGMATIDISDTFQPGRYTTYKIPGLPGSTTEQAGGGTWTYGWNLINATTKQCFSKPQSTDGAEVLSGFSV